MPVFICVYRPDRRARSGLLSPRAIVGEDRLKHPEPVLKGCVRTQNHRWRRANRWGSLLHAQLYKEEGTMARPYCQGNATQQLERTTTLRYRVVPLSPLSAHVQRADEHALQPAISADRHRPARGPPAFALQTAPARLGRDIPHARLYVHPPDGARVGGALRPPLSERLRAKRHGEAGRKWHCDET